MNKSTNGIKSKKNNLNESTGKVATEESYLRSWDSVTSEEEISVDVAKNNLEHLKHAIRVKKRFRIASYVIIAVTLVTLILLYSFLFDKEYLSTTWMESLNPFYTPYFYLCNPITGGFVNYTVISVKVYDKVNDNYNASFIQINNGASIETCLALNKTVVDASETIIARVYKIESLVSYNPIEEAGRILGNNLYMSSDEYGFVNFHKTDEQFIAMQDFSSIIFNVQTISSRTGPDDTYFPSTISTIPIIGSSQCYNSTYCTAYSIASIQISSTVVQRLTYESTSAHVFRVFGDFGGHIATVTTIITILFFFLNYFIFWGDKHKRTIEVQYYRQWKSIKKLTNTED